MALAIMLKKKAVVAQATLWHLVKGLFPLLVNTENHKWPSVNLCRAVVSNNFLEENMQFKSLIIFCRLRVLQRDRGGAQPFGVFGFI